MNRLEKTAVSIILATTGIISWNQAPSADNEKDMIRYSKVTLHVNKTESHDAYDVYNGIIEPSKDNRPGREFTSVLKFCDSDSGAFIEVPLSDTDYKEQDRAIIGDELKGKIPPTPLYKARAGENPCDLIEGKLVKRATAIKRSNLPICGKIKIWKKEKDYPKAIVLETNTEPGGKLVPSADKPILRNLLGLKPTLDR